MTAPTTQSKFPILRMLAWLTAATAVMGTLNALLLPAVFGERPGVAKAAVLTAIVVFIAGVACAIPLFKARNSLQLTQAFFVGMAVRVAIALVAAMIAVMALKLPKVPVAASLMLAYLPALFIETRFVIKHVAVLDAAHKAALPANPEASSTDAADAQGHTDSRHTPGHSEILA